MNPAPRLVTVRHAAPLIDMSEGALRKLIARRDLPPGIVVRFGGRALRLDLEALIAWAKGAA